MVLFPYGLTTHGFLRVGLDWHISPHPKERWWHWRSVCWQLYHVDLDSAICHHCEENVRNHYYCRWKKTFWWSLFWCGLPEIHENSELPRTILSGPVPVTKWLAMVCGHMEGNVHLRCFVVCARKKVSAGKKTLFKGDIAGCSIQELCGHKHYNPFVGVVSIRGLLWAQDSITWNVVCQHIN